jgi:hypothetical protein
MPFALFKKLLDLHNVNICYKRCQEIGDTPHSVPYSILLSAWVCLILLNVTVASRLGSSH